MPPARAGGYIEAAAACARGLMTGQLRACLAVLVQIARRCVFSAHCLSACTHTSMPRLAATAAADVAPSNVRSSTSAQYTHSVVRDLFMHAASNPRQCVEKLVVHVPAAVGVTERDHHLLACLRTLRAGLAGEAAGLLHAPWRDPRVPR
jgi:hypothetical protein